MSYLIIIKNNNSKDNNTRKLLFRQKQHFIKFHSIYFRILTKSSIDRLKQNLHRLKLNVQYVYLLSFVTHPGFRYEL